MRPTDVNFYASHSDEVLTALIARFAADGQRIAAQFGAGHDLAKELAGMWAAATGQQILRAAR